MSSGVQTCGDADSPSSELPPSYELEFRRVYDQWDASHKAAIQLMNVEVELLQRNTELQAAKKELTVLKTKSAALFDSLHPKKRHIFSFLSSKKSGAQGLQGPASEPGADKITIQETFEQSHAQEVQKNTAVEELEARLKALEAQRKSLSTIASASDHDWTGLQLIAQGDLPNEDDARPTETECEEAHRETTALTRVCISFQHAHKYYCDVLKVYDDLNPLGLGSTISEGMGGSLVNMTKENAYKNAIKQAETAQACLDEGFRCLRPFKSTVPEEHSENYAVLETMGVMQIKKIYDLMYGGSSVDGSVKKSVKTMSEKQEVVFRHLTALAVWVQNRVPECEIAERMAKLHREEGRRRLADGWMTGQLSR